MHRFLILLVDDDPSILKYLQAIFKDTEYETITATDGLMAIETVKSEMPDMLILDFMMPKFDGLQVCNRLREWSQIPIIMLSANINIEDKVKCLEAGADDYVCKPFDAEELIARVNSVLRRSKGNHDSPVPTVFSIGNLTIDFNSRRVTSSSTDVKLTPTEYSLLRELAANIGKVLDHTYLLKTVWGSEYSGETEYLRVFVNRLRAKLEPDPSNPKYIITAPGIGYMFNRDI